MNPTLPPPRLPPPVGVEHALSLVLVNVKATAAHSSPASDPSPTRDHRAAVFTVGGVVPAVGPVSHCVSVLQDKDAMKQLSFVTV